MRIKVCPDCGAEINAHLEWCERCGWQSGEKIYNLSQLLTATSIMLVFLVLAGLWLYDSFAGVYGAFSSNGPLAIVACVVLALATGWTAGRFWKSPGLSAEQKATKVIGAIGIALGSLAILFAEWRFAAGISGSATWFEVALLLITAVVAILASLRKLRWKQ